MWELLEIVLAEHRRLFAAVMLSFAVVGLIGVFVGPGVWVSVMRIAVLIVGVTAGFIWDRSSR